MKHREWKHRPTWAALALTVLSLSACASGPGSAYKDGWTETSSEHAYTECSVVHLAKGQLVPQNLDALVGNGMLTPAQAARVRAGTVRVGDPECLAYAAYGLQRAKITLTRDPSGKLLSKTVAYVCGDSDAPCPGVNVEFVDGRVAETSPLK